MRRALHSLTGCTICAPAEIPQAIVLANSFLRFHPQNEFAILLLDHPQPGNGESFPRGTRLLYPADLGLEVGEEWRLPMLYKAQELTPILMPALLQSLLKSGSALAVYFEVATEIFGSLSGILGEIQNPLGLIEAFTKAFSNGEGPPLVIKTINGDKRCLEAEKLRYASRGRCDIILMDGYLSPIENNTLTALSDCYVSLHRSEGFGLTIAEAMALGEPTIATAYSGNLEFMTPDNSYLCPSRRCRVGLGREPYPSESYWSSPDVSSAAELLRHVYDDPTEAHKRGTRAAEDVRSFHAPAPAGQIIAERLAIIRRRRADLDAIRSIGFRQDRVEELEARLRGETAHDP